MMSLTSRSSPKTVYSSSAGPIRADSPTDGCGLGDDLGVDRVVAGRPDGAGGSQVDIPCTASPRSVKRNRAIRPGR